MASATKRKNTVALMCFCVLWIERYLPDLYVLLSVLPVPGDADAQGLTAAFWNTDIALDTCQIEKRIHTHSDFILFYFGELLGKKKGLLFIGSFE